MSEHPLALITGLQNAYVALREARSDFERLQIRDQARAASVAAEVLKRRDIQSEASILVAAAERAIAKANPPQQGRRTDLENNFVPPEHEVGDDLVKKVRQAHDSLTDEQFSAIANKAREEQEPLTRTVLKREARKLNPDSTQPPADDKPPTRTVRLEAERDALAMEVQAKAQRIAELEDEVRFLRGESSDLDHDREATFTRQQAEISALRASWSTAEQKANEERRSRLYWERQAKALGWQPQSARSTPPAPAMDSVEEPETALLTNEPEDDYPLQSTDLEEAHWDQDYLDSLPPDDQPDPDLEEEVEDSPDPFVALQSFGGFQVGEHLVTDEGEAVMFQGRASDGIRAQVGTEYGLGVIVPIELDRLSLPEDEA